MIKIVNWFFAIYWALMFVLLCLGTYQPNKIVIGCAFLVAIASFISFALII